jgi:PKD repeat protein
MFTDNNGNSFLAGYVSGDQYAPFYHYGDSSITQTNPLLISNAVVAKIDSNGHTVWLNFPPPTAFTSGGNYIAVQPDNQGNICLLASFKGAGSWGSFIIPSKGYYVLKFAPDNGNLIGVTKLDYNVNSGHSYLNINFTVDSDNSFYLTDLLEYQDTIIVGSNTIIRDSDNVYVYLLTKYLSTGNLAWYKEVRGNFTAGQWKAIIGMPIINENSVYITGVAQNNVNFFGSIISNPYVQTPLLQTPFIARFRKDNGDFVSLKHIYNRVLTIFDIMAVTSNGIVVTGTTGAGTSGHEIMMYNLTDTLKPGSTYNTAYPFILGIDTALSNFNWGIATRVDDAYSRIESLTVDLSDNVYAGGKFADSIYNSFGVGIQSHGGTSDFFIAKIAANNNCSCVKSQPFPQLLGINNYILTVKGTASGIADSLVWIWGDGTKTKYLIQNTIATHTYATGGNYNICLRTYNYCGTKDSCFAISGVGIEEQELKYLNAYPNPVTNSLTIENPYQCSMQLNIYSITGKLLYSNKYENYTTTIDMSKYESGIYFIEMILADGRKGMRKVVKE